MAHIHELERACEQPGCGANPKTRQLRWVLRAATVYSALTAALLLIVGTKSDNPAPVAESAHQAGDTAVPAGNALTLAQEAKYADNPSEYNLKRVKRARVFTAACIGAGVLYAGYNTVEAIQNPEHIEYSSVVLGAEVAAAAGSLTLRQAVRMCDDGSRAATDAERHLNNDFRLSGLAAGSILLTKYGVDDAQIVFSAAATAMTARVAWLTGTGNGHVHDSAA